MTTQVLSRPVGRVGRVLASRHALCLNFFAVVVLLHWMEHLVQAAQIWVLGWPIPRAGGVLGLWFPWLITSEVMHYGYALVMLVMLWLLRDGFAGRVRQWWMLAFALQFWHHIEHLLLFGQALLGVNLGGGPVRMSLLQFFVPRVELHLFYNTVVTIPMVVAIVLHRRRARTRAPLGRSHDALVG